MLESSKLKIFYTHRSYPKDNRHFLSSQIYSDRTTKFLFQYFSNYFGLSEWDAEVLDRPEIFSTDIAYSCIVPTGCTAVSVNFTVPPVYRALYHARNVLYHAPAYDTAHTPPAYEALPLEDEDYVLALADEVWVPTAKALSILQARGFTHVRLVRPPLPPIRKTRRANLTSPLARGELNAYPLDTFVRSLTSYGINRPCSRLSDHIGPFQDRAEQTVFATRVEPETWEPNLKSLVTAFLEFSRSDATALLLVAIPPAVGKVVEKTIQEILAQQDMLPIGAYSKRILIVDDTIEGSNWADLAPFIDFVIDLTGSYQINLPALSAVAAGAVPICVAGATTTEFLVSDCTITVESTLTDTHSDFLRRTVPAWQRTMMLHRHLAKAEAFRAALTKAATLPLEWREAWSRRNQEALRPLGEARDLEAALLSTLKA